MHRNLSDFRLFTEQLDALLAVQPKIRGIPPQTSSILSTGMAPPGYSIPSLSKADSTPGKSGCLLFVVIAALVGLAGVCFATILTF